MARRQCERCKRYFEAPASGRVACEHCGHFHETRPQPTVPQAPPGGTTSPAPAAPGAPGAGFQVVQRPGAGSSNGLAVTSLVLGILGLCIVWLGLGILFGLGALVLGIVAKQQIGRTPGQTGSGLAVAGIVLGAITLGVWLFWQLFWFVIFDEFFFPWPPRRGFFGAFPMG